MPATEIEADEDNTRQPRPRGFSLKKWVGEKALASAGHVSPRTP